MIEREIIDLLTSQVFSAQNPNNPNDIHTFANIEELVETFIQFLKFPSHEPSLERGGSKVLEAFSIFAAPALDTHKLPSALEDLATGFESYLKKIAVLRYECDTVKLHGDGINYLGLLHTTLGPLLEGKVAKVNPRDTSIPILNAPVVTFTYRRSNIRETIYDRVRILRNEIHEASQKSYLDLFRLFQIAAAGYLFALEENFCLIRQRVDPLFSYLMMLEEEFKKLERKYVELAGEERKPLLESWPDLQAFEWKDEIDEYPEEVFPWEKLEENIEVDLNPTQTSSQTSVIILANTQHRFWLIGEPGAGKTTTIQRIAWLRAKDLLDSCYLLKPCPIIIKANQYDKSYPFRKIISDQVKISQTKIDELLHKGKLWLLIDGWNEIATSEQEYAFRDLQHILNEFDVPVLLSSRKYGFKHHFDIPIFEILPLNEQLIQEYLERNMPTPEQGKRMFEQLISAKSLLLDFATNPLMLRMLIRVSKDGTLPANRGQLFKLFIKWFFNREEKVIRQTETYLKEDILTTIAFEMRKSGKTYLPQAIIFTNIKKALARWHATTNISDLFHELLNNGLLEVDANEKVTFFHELILEYFASLELLHIYLSDKNLIQRYCNQVTWFEPIIMLAGLLDQADEFVSIVLQKDLALAARCVASGANITQPLVLDIIKVSEQILSEYNNDETTVMAITALLELGTDDSLRLIINSLKNDFRSILTKALYKCERPEICALRLLNMGLTGKKLIYECLKIFESSFVNRTILDNPYIAQAELNLLSGKLDHHYIVLIDAVGIPIGIRSKVFSIIKKALETEPLNSQIWRASLAIAVHQNFIEQLAELIKVRVLQADYSDINIYYPIFVACQALRHLPLSNELAWYSTRNCLQLRQYNMASKFIKYFNMQNELSKQEVLEYAQDMADNGRIGALLEFLALFPEVDIYPYLNTVVDRQLKKLNLDILLEHQEELAPIFSEKSEILRDIVLSKASSATVRPRTIKNYIKVFHLERYFSGMGIIKNYLKKKGTGFITDLVTEEDIFFLVSRVTNLPPSRKIKVRALVKYKRAKQPSQRFASKVTFIQ